MANQKITLPEIGDGISSGVVINIQKKANDSIAEGEIILEVETDKAAFPVNAPFDGELKKILVKEGEEIAVGGVLAEVELAGGTSPVTPAEPMEKTEEKNAKEEKVDSPQAPFEQLAPSSPSSSPATPKPVEEKASPKITRVNEASFNIVAQAHAGPQTRKLARELGVDLNLVTGTERGGRISVQDVKLFVKNTMTSGAATNAPVGAPAKDLPDFTKFGEVEVKPASNLRKTISEQISYSANIIPHVHQQEEVDLTQIEHFQKEFKKEFKEKGSSLSVTVFIIKALAVAINKFPQFNSSYDAQKNLIHYKKYSHIGVAVDTPNGLIVPVIKNVDKLSLFDIGKALIDLAKQTRDRTVKLEDLKGASITISNLGGIGGTSFTPIINWPEVAILGVGKSSLKPIYHDGNWIPKTIMSIVLAYDHRIIDGADGARFITFLKNILEKPEKFLIGLEK